MCAIAIVTNQEGRVSLDEDHMLFDARKPVIRVCDAVALSHVHAATMRVYTGENVRASSAYKHFNWFVIRCFDRIF